MAFSALYLHNVHHRAATRRPSLAQLSGYHFQEEAGGWAITITVIFIIIMIVTITITVTITTTREEEGERAPLIHMGDS